MNFFLPIDIRRIELAFANVLCPDPYTWRNDLTSIRGMKEREEEPYFFSILPQLAFLVVSFIFPLYDFDI